MNPAEEFLGQRMIFKFKLRHYLEWHSRGRTC